MGKLAFGGPRTGGHLIIRQKSRKSALYNRYDSAENRIQSKMSKKCSILYSRFEGENLLFFWAGGYFSFFCRNLQLLPNEYSREYTVSVNSGTIQKIWGLHFCPE